MENQYSYYQPEQDNVNHTQEEQGTYQEAPQTPRQPKKKFPLWAKVIGCALIFGLVASATFQASNVVFNRFFGGNESSSNNSQQVSNAQLTTTSNSTVTSDVSEIAANAMPSVVSITNMSVQQVQNFFGGVQEQESESAGSGIIISQNDSELLVLTNNHVVEGSDTLTVTFINEESVEANVKGTDAARDLAVVAVNLDDIPSETKEAISVAVLGDSTQLQVGEPVIAIGNALGYGQSVTTGIVSATNRTLEGFDSELVQTDAAINPGNSGGALLNANGEVIGINTAKVATSAVEGMGYAIPISDASDVITDLMNRETRTKVAEEEQGFLGIQGVDVTSDSAQMYDMPEGVYISEAIEGGGAASAGLTKGSVITALDGTTIDSMETLQEQLEYYAAGETVTVTVQVPGNNGEYTEQSVEVTLGSRS